MDEMHATNEPSGPPPRPRLAVSSRPAKHAVSTSTLPMRTVRGGPTAREMDGCCCAARAARCGSINGSRT